MAAASLNERALGSFSVALAVLLGAASIATIAWRGTAPLSLAVGTALVAAVLALSPLRLAKGAARWSCADPIVIGGALFGGPAVAVLTGVAEAAAIASDGGSQRARRALLLRHLASAVGGVAAFEVAMPALTRAGARGSAELVAPVVAMASARFAIGLAFAWQEARGQRRPLRRIAGASALLQIGLHYGAGALALVAWVGVSHFGSIALAIALATGALGVSVFRSWGDRVRARQEYLLRLQTLHRQVMESFALAIDARDPNRAGRARRVRAYVETLGRLVAARAETFAPGESLDEGWLESLKAAAALQDVGKLGLPDHLLLRGDNAKQADDDALRGHAVLSEKIIGKLGFGKPLGPMVRHHHECWDGSGYPDGLQGEAIPLESRILAFADGLDRAHAQASVSASARADIDALRNFAAKHAGTAFDPRLARLYCEQAPSIERDVAALERTLARERSEAPDDTSGAQGVGDLRREAHLVFELSRQLGSTLEVHELVGLVLGRLLELTPAHSAALYLSDEATARLVPHGVHGPWARALGARSFESGEGHTGWCFEKREVVFDADPRVDFGSTIASLPHAPGRLTAFPIADERDAIGVVAFHAAPEAAWNEGQSRTVLALMPEICAALRNALLYKRTRESSMTDSLTGLPNSRSLHAHLEREIARATRAASMLSVAVLDLDGFKPINDEHGHQAGDLVLKEVANELTRSFRGCDTVCRYAGDEFVALLPGATLEQARAIVERVQDAVYTNAVLLPSGVEVRVGISAGVSCFPIDGGTAEALIRRADKEMYRDKARRRCDPVRA